MKLYIQGNNASPNIIVRVAMEFSNIRPEMTSDMSGTEQHKRLGIAPNAPLLVTEEGALDESLAIAKYFGTMSGKLLGSNAVERSQVDQWISYGITTLSMYHNADRAIFGTAPVTTTQFNDAVKGIKAVVKTLNTVLEGKKYLAGDQVSVADIACATALMPYYQTILDGGFRKGMKNATAWAESLFETPEFVKVVGKVQMCAKALKPNCVEEKKVEKKKAAPVAAAAPKKVVEKKLDNVQSLPPTTFDLYDFKTFYVNHPDKAGAAVDEWYKMLDWEGWAFWEIVYDKLEGECAKVHVTNNMLGGFLSRAEHTNKYTFARMGVFGDEPDLNIKGVWLMRGKDEIPDGLAKEHSQFEYYKSKKLDPRNVPADDKLIREYFAGKEETKIDGHTCQTLKWFK